MKAALTAFMAVMLLAALSAPARAQLKQYKELRNNFIKVIDVREMDKTEEKYVDVGGKLELKEVTRKTLRVTAEIVSKPPTTMSNMFNDEKAEPFFKICLASYDAKDAKIGDDDCGSFKFSAWVKGNIGVEVFDLPEGMSRYELSMVKDVSKKGESFKLWVPTE